MLSVIIPSYKDPLLHKTIDSLLENAEGEIEIIPVLDGYWPETPIRSDPRIRIVHLGKNRGMRGAINAGVSVARGEFIMRTDEHCMFAKGFDMAMKSFKIFNDNFSNSRLTIIGWGTDELFLKGLARNLGIEEQVSFI